MSYRPDESVLISWLYGELDEVEKEKVDRYFLENPDELRKMQQLGAAKDIMSNARDKEVIAPPMFMGDDEEKVIPIWRTGYFRVITTIAASFLLLIVAGKLLDLDVRYSNNELRISFGKPTTGTVTPNSLTAMEVQRMIDESSKKNQEFLKTELDASVKQTLANNTSQINDLMKRASTASKDEIRNFVATLQRDNLAQTREYLQLSASDQRKYTDNLIVEFSKYLNEQRTQDLNMFQVRFNALERNTDELKSETEQILASIISNAPQVQQSSY